MAPLVWLSQWITKLFSRRADEGSVSREEFAALAELGAAEGVTKLPPGNGNLADGVNE